MSFRQSFSDAGGKAPRNLNKYLFLVLLRRFLPDISRGKLSLVPRFVEMIGVFVTVLHSMTIIRTSIITFFLRNRRQHTVVEQPSNQIGDGCNDSKQGDTVEQCQASHSFEFAKIRNDTDA